MMASSSTPHHTGTYNAFATPSRHRSGLRTTIATPTGTITPSRAVLAPTTLPALSRPLRHHVFARDPLLKQQLLDDLSALDFAIQHQSESVLEGKRAHAAEMAELEEAGRGLEASLAQAGRDATQLVKDLEGERGELDAAKNRGRELEERRKGMRTQLEGLKAEIEEWAERVKRKKQEKGGKKEEMMALKGETDREMAWLESFVGMKVRGKTGAPPALLHPGPCAEPVAVPANVLHFKFTYIDAADFGRPFTFDVDTSSHTYSVPDCRPPLRPSTMSSSYRPVQAELPDAAQMPALVDALNTDRDFYAFLKSVRKAFRDSVEQERARR